MVDGRGSAAWQQAGFAAALAGVAGSVDAIGYLSVFHIFTAHMTGNTVDAAVSAAQGQWRDALARVVVVPLFVLGVTLGAAAIEVASRLGVRRPMPLALGLEGLLLLGAIVVGDVPGPRRATAGAVANGLSPYVALLVLAMGLQNTALRRVGAISLRTTYITGTLTTLAEELVHYLGCWLDRAPGHPHDTARAARQREAAAHVWLLAGVWCAYALGAIMGTWAELSWTGWSLSLPLVALAVIVVAALARPVPAPSGS